MTTAQTALGVAALLMIIMVIATRSGYEEPVPRTVHGYAKAPSPPKAPRRSRLDPERAVMTGHVVGVSAEEPRALDELDITTDFETPDDKYYRSITQGEIDGPMAEGMSVPIDQFERSALIRQDAKRQAIYGDLPHVPGKADAISRANV